MIHQFEIILKPYPKGFHLITDEIYDHLKDLPEKGLVNLFIRHTSAGLTINENADPTVRIDFETIFNRLIPENMHYMHDSEGSDDMPAHIKTALTGNSLTVPICHKKLALGTWQGIYLCEFRRNGGGRKIMVTVWGD